MPSRAATTLAALALVRRDAVAGRGAPRFTTRRALTPETALKAAQAAMAKCRADGFQVAVAVVDRCGLTQVLLRDRFAGAHTVEVAHRTRPGPRSRSAHQTSGARAGDRGRASSMPGCGTFPGVAAVGGGMMIEAGGSLLGGIGVSGAPGGDERRRRAPPPASRRSPTTWSSDGSARIPRGPRRARPPRACRSPRARRSRATARRSTTCRAFGNVSLLHMTDCHAQLLPVYFREPNVNLGVGERARQAAAPGGRASAASLRHSRRARARRTPSRYLDFEQRREGLRHAWAASRTSRRW